MTQEITHEQTYGGSVTFCDYILEHQLEAIRPASLVDFGAGGGKNGRIAKQILGEACRLVAVEGFEQTVAMLRTTNLYHEAHCALLQEWVANNTMPYDLAIFGDVMEHLKPGEIHTVLSKCLTQFKHVIIVTPLHDLYQDELYGNDLETHRTYITFDFFDRYRPVEKHTVHERSRTILNIHLTAQMSAKSKRHRLLRWIFHRVVLALQTIGLAVPFFAFVKKYFNRYLYIFKDQA